jgi:hypothetical protein
MVDWKPIFKENLEQSMAQWRIFLKARGPRNSAGDHILVKKKLKKGEWKGGVHWAF